jgi:hypothetical protein
MDEATVSLRAKLYVKVVAPMVKPASGRARPAAGFVELINPSVLSQFKRQRGMRSFAQVGSLKRDIPFLACNMKNANSHLQ